MPRAADRPLKQHQAKTLFLRVPSHLWTAVSTGKVREFRAATGNVPQLWNVPLPTLTVAYRKRRGTPNYDYRLLVLQDVRHEALGAITEEGLAAAGYTGKDARSRFRRDWMIAEKRRFEPLRQVAVFTVRLPGEGDAEQCARALLRHLYGEHLDVDRVRTVTA